jgi:DNA-binding MarR family transcriptional regulator
MSEGVSTEMDQLMELIDEVNTIKVGDAANELGVDKSLVEGWAKMLEKAGAVEIHYSVIGGAVLRKGKKFDQVWCKSTKKQEKECPDENKAVEEAKKIVEKPVKEKDMEESNPEIIDAFPLIRKDLVDSNKEIKSEIEKIREEEKRVIEYMDALVAEGQKLSKRLDEMAIVAEKMKKTKTASS